MTTESMELRTKAHKLVVDAQSDLTSATLTPELEIKVDAQLEEARKLEARATTLEELHEMESRMNAVDTSKRPDEARKIETATGKKSESDEMRSFLRNRQYGGEMEVRAGQVVGTNSAGGYAVPTGFYNELTVSLIKYSPLGDPSITDVMTTDHGNSMQFATINDTASKGFILGEALQANSSNTFVLAQKAIGAYTFTNDVVLFSYELLEDNAVDLEARLVGQLGLRIGRAMGNAFTVGTGTGQPTGMVVAANAVAGAATMTANAGVIGYTDLLSVFHATEPAYRENPKFAWFMNDNTLLKIRSILDLQNRPIIDYGNLQVASAPAALFGKKLITNQAMASVASGAVPIVIGDGQGFMVRKTGDIQIQRLVERYADFRQVGYVAFVRADSNLLDNAALKTLYIK